ncbi:hypothetical protein HDU76_000362 [Blyttiomyces sp. JEL0837]|nr:hypothetical protein HDU76_000362 [Blyttiomyces sp. JEL0837]
MIAPIALALTIASAVIAFPSVAPRDTPLMPDPSKFQKSWQPTDHYGVLPRHNITQQDIKDALAAFGADEDIQKLFSSQAIVLNNGKTNAAGLPVIDLKDLDFHGNSSVGIEHDASLTRSDTNLGDNTKFNDTLFKQMLSYATPGSPYLTEDQLIKYRKAREAASNKNNNQYLFDLRQQTTAYGEAALLVLSMGDKDGNMRIDWLKTLFRNESFPFDQGFTLKNITQNEVLTKALAMKVKALNPFF